MINDDNTVYANLELNVAIARFDDVVAEIKRLQGVKALLADRILSESISAPRSGNTFRVESRSGVRLKVELKSKSEWDNDQLLDARNLLGSAKFDELFKSKIEFTAQKRNLTAFLGTVTSDEGIETAKTVIRNAQIETQLPPYISVEVSKATEAQNA